MTRLALAALVALAACGRARRTYPNDGRALFAQLERAGAAARTHDVALIAPETAELVPAEPEPFGLAYRSGVELEQLADGACLSVEVEARGARLYLARFFCPDGSEGGRWWLAHAGDRFVRLGGAVRDDVGARALLVIDPDHAREAIEALPDDALR